MNNQQFVKIAETKIGLPYWFGTFGQIASAALLENKKKQYPNQYTPDRIPIYTQQFGKQVFDCSGLLKYILMTEGETKTLSYNSALDYSADSFYQKAPKKGDISTLPEIPGIALHRPGHIGIYAGNGKVIEARGFAYGVVKSDIQGRGFLHWLYVPHIDYDTITPDLHQIADQLRTIASQLDK